MNWEVPKMWEDGECWIIGGGPSVAQQFEVPKEVIADVLLHKSPISVYSPYLSQIHDKHVIGINVAFMLGMWVDIVFFGDGGFYFKNREALDKFPKAKVCCNPNLHNRPQVVNVKFMRRNGKRPFGITTTSGLVSWNENSGAAAISLAVQLGVKRIYLLGFDMTLGDGGHQHWHNQYGKEEQAQPRGIQQKKRNNKRLPFERHLRSFPAIAIDAKNLGIEIINVCPNSAIKQFPRVSLKEVL